MNTEFVRQNFFNDGIKISGNVNQSWNNYAALPKANFRFAHNWELCTCVYNHFFRTLSIRSITKTCTATVHIPDSAVAFIVDVDGLNNVSSVRVPSPSLMSFGVPIKLMWLRSRGLTSISGVINSDLTKGLKFPRCTSVRIFSIRFFFCSMKDELAPENWHESVKGMYDKLISYKIEHFLIIMKDRNIQWNPLASATLILTLFLNAAIRFLLADHTYGNMKIIWDVKVIWL